LDSLLKPYISVGLTRASSRANVKRILETNISLNHFGPAPSIDRVARHSGLSVSAIYRYFSNRQRLHAASLQHLIIQFRQDIRTLLLLEHISADDIDTFCDRTMNKLNQCRPALVNLLCSIDDDEAARILKKNQFAMIDMVRRITSNSDKSLSRLPYERDMQSHFEDIARLLIDNLYQCPDSITENSNRLRLRALMRDCLTDLNFYAAAQARILPTKAYQFSQA
jgi:AcrR family transcriptional regulator